jgi:hypothetical protein
LEFSLSTIKDIFTIIIAITATIISIFAYRRARATVLQPIRSEVIKKQSQILSEILTFLPRDTFDKNLDYIGIASVNAYLALKDYGFIFKGQNEITENIDKKVSGWIFCGEDDVIKDVEIIGMFTKSQEKEEKIQEGYKLGKERFENVKKNIISIEKIFFTQEFYECFKKLSEYADNPFLPQNIQIVFKKLISDIQINLRLHLKNTLVKFIREFCQEYFGKSSYPNILPIGVYNEFNHNRIHHGTELNNLKSEIRKYLKIDDKW